MLKERILFYSVSSMKFNLCVQTWKKNRKCLKNVQGKINIPITHKIQCKSVLFMLIYC